MSTLTHQVDQAIIDRLHGEIGLLRGQVAALIAEKIALVEEIERLREQLVKANAEIEALKHDIERHIKIASDALSDEPSDGAIYAAVSQRHMTQEEREGIEEALRRSSTFVSTLTDENSQPDSALTSAQGKSDD